MANPRKPTALKLLQGNPGKRKLSEDEPRPKTGAEMPEELLGLPDALRAWKKWAPILAGLGILTEIDGPAFGRLCCLWAEQRQRLREDRPSDSQLLSEIRRLEALFGMNPADRSRLHVAAPKPETKLSRFRGARKA